MVELIGVDCHHVVEGSPMWMRVGRENRLDGILMLMRLKVLELISVVSPHVDEGRLTN